MSSETIAVTEGEILSHAIGSIEESGWRELAKIFSGLKLPDSDLDRVDSLLDKNRTGVISAQERSELEKYLRVGTFLDLVRARALRELSDNSK